ncbi:hypothetical protein [Comamonas thiooxydans]|uniref:hypothetical protein n=1 Tax=Comamonas thiooxydans TaxID=363952 RepID=UPI00057B23B7|nr:hypothetical protein [Comamonas thiooxydans]
MNALVIALVITLAFIGFIFALHRLLQHKVRRQEMSPLFAIFIVWFAVLWLPLLLTFLWGAIAAYMLQTFTALQTASWDVGLAISLYLGMCLSYLSGVLAAILISWNFLSESRT